VSSLLADSLHAGQRDSALTEIEQVISLSLSLSLGAKSTRLKKQRACLESAEHISGTAILLTIPSSDLAVPLPPPCTHRLRTVRRCFLSAGFRHSRGSGRSLFQQWQPRSGPSDRPLAARRDYCSFMVARARGRSTVFRRRPFPRPSVRQSSVSDRGEGEGEGWVAPRPTFPLGGCSVRGAGSPIGPRPRKICLIKGGSGRRENRGGESECRAVN